jgi:hypothetical protein
MREPSHPRLSLLIESNQKSGNPPTSKIGIEKIPKHKKIGNLMNQENGFAN